MLQQIQDNLLEEYEVTGDQLSTTLAATSQLGIQRQLKALEKQIQKIELELELSGESEWERGDQNQQLEFDSDILQRTVPKPILYQSPIIAATNNSGKIFERRILRQALH